MDLKRVILNWSFPIAAVAAWMYYQSKKGQEFSEKEIEDWNKRIKATKKDLAE